MTPELTRDFFSHINTIGQQGFNTIREGFTAGIYIPANVTRIGNTAFYRNNAVRTIYFGDALHPVSLSTLSVSSSSGIFGAVGNESNISDLYIYTQDSEASWDDVIATNFGISTVY